MSLRAGGVPLPVNKHGCVFAATVSRPAVQLHVVVGFYLMDCISLRVGAPLPVNRHGRVFFSGLQLRDCKSLRAFIQ